MDFELWIIRHTDVCYRIIVAGGGHSHFLCIRSMITPLHTFPTLFISWASACDLCVRVTWWTVSFPPVPCSSTAPLLVRASAPGLLHPWWTERVLGELTKLPLQPLTTHWESRSTLCYAIFCLDKIPCDIKSETLSASLSGCCGPGERVLLIHSSILSTGLYFIFQFSLADERNALQASSGTNYWFKITFNLFPLFIYAHLYSY